MLKAKTLKLLLIVFLVFLPFCDEENQDNTAPGSSSSWLIPNAQVVDGGPGKDGIAAISTPLFIKISEVDFLTEDDLVIGFQTGDFVRAFPHRILDYHEIVNHTIDNIWFVLTYCPLTGSGIVWDTSNFSGDRSFGVSGLLYNSNLIPYDRSTDSNWSQMLNLCVNGSRVGQEAKLIPVVETTWQTWKQLYPDSLILSTDTGFNRDYEVFPYGDYKSSDQLLFQVSHQDSRLANKERVHGIVVGEKTKAYQIKTFNGSIEVINENFNGLDIVVVGSTIRNFAVSYRRKLQDETVLTFEPIEGELPIIMMDNEGTKWDIFGHAVSGPRKGERLTATESFIAYWFAWAAFYPNAEIQNHPLLTANGQALSSENQGEMMLNSTSVSFLRKEFIRSQIGRRFLKEWTKIATETKVVQHLNEDKVAGIRILEIPEESLFTELGIQQGDIIKEINGYKIKSPRTLSKLFKKLIDQNRFEISIQRNGELMYLFYDLK